MTITEFARARGVDPKTVNAYMKNHNIKYDRKLGLTDTQIEILEKKYRLPAPVTVITGLDPEEERILRQRLDDTQSKIISLMETVSAQALRLSDMEHEKALLELKAGDKDKEIAELREELDTLKKPKKRWWSKI